jgi:hypothetical protein
MVCRRGRSLKSVGVQAVLRSPRGHTVISFGPLVTPYRIMTRVIQIAISDYLLVGCDKRSQYRDGVPARAIVEVRRCASCSQISARAHRDLVRPTCHTLPHNAPFIELARALARALFQTLDLTRQR